MALARRAGAGARWLAARPLAALFLVYLVVVIGFVVPRITADGVAYYAEARSILFDGDLDLANEYALDSQVYSPLSDAGPRAFLPRDELGRFQHNVNVGIVVLFAPFLLVAHGIAFLLNLVGLATPMDGYAQVYVLALSFGTSALLAAAVALMVSYGRTLVGPGIALAGGVAAWLGTSVFYWAVFRPAHAHAPAVLLEALFVVLFLSRARRVDDRLAWFLLGAVGGLMLTVRPVTGLYAAVPAAYLVLVVLGRLRDAWRAEHAGCRSGRPGRSGRRSGSRQPASAAARSAVGAVAAAVLAPAIAGLLFLAGSFLGRLPQFVFARDLGLFGTSFYSDSGYLDEGLAGTPLDGVASLVVHPLQGNLWWAPLVPLSLIGLAAFWRRDRLTALAGVAWAALIWGFVSLLGVPERFGGFGLESRHLVEATPVYMLGAMGLLALGRDAVRALLRRRRSTLARTVALAAGFGMVAVVAWNVLAHVASLIIQVAGASPAERVLRLLARPPVLGRLYLDRATLEAPEGRVFLGGRLLTGLARGDTGALFEALGYGVLAAALGAAVLLLAGLVWRWVDRRPVGAGSANMRSGAAGRLWPAVAWLGPALLLGALVAPSLAPPSRVAADSDERQRLVEYRPVAAQAPEGTVAEVRIGDSPQGNAVLEPPPPAAPDVGFSVGVPDRYELLTGRHEVALQPPGDWAALAGVTIHLRDVPAEGGALQVSLWRGDEPLPQVRTLVEGSALRDGPLRVALPLGLLDAEVAPIPLRIVVEPAPEGVTAAVGLTGGGSLALDVHGIQRDAPAAALLDGRPLFEGHSQRLPPLPADGSIRVSDEGSASVRYGPWPAESLLRWSIDHPGWRLPGPVNRAASWSGSTARGPDGGPIVVRIVAPAPMTEVTAHLLFTAYGPTTARARIEASLDGRTWQHLGDTAAPQPLRLAHAAATLRLAGDSDVWFRLDVPPGTDGLVVNGAWFDARLDVPAATALGSTRAQDLTLAEAEASALVDTEESRSGTMVTAVAAVPVEGLGALFYAAGSAAEALLRGFGPWQPWLLAAAAWVAAVLLIRRRHRWEVSIPIAALALMLTAAGLAQLPTWGSRVPPPAVEAALADDGPPGTAR